MSSIMRWRNGLMGLSDIAKAPVSHGGLNPTILRQAQAFAFLFQPTDPPPRTRRPYRASGLVLTSTPDCRWLIEPIRSRALGSRGFPPHLVGRLVLTEGEGHRASVGRPEFSPNGLPSAAGRTFVHPGLIDARRGLLGEPGAGRAWLRAPSLFVFAEVVPNGAMRVASQAAIQAEIA